MMTVDRKQIIDISWPLSNQIVTYKNKGDVSIMPVRTLEQHGSRESKISCGMHTGTHIDAPAHFLPTGQTTEQLDLTQLIGVCQVFDLTHLTTKIMVADLQQLNFTHKIALFKTKNSLLPSVGLFDPHFVYLEAAAAQFLVTKHLTVVGVDGLGVERDQPDHTTHNILFQSNIIIIEGLRLGLVAPGSYDFICLPLSIIGAEAALARAILISRP